MNIRILGSNQTVLRLNDGREVFFSYETPVAGFGHKGAFRTTEHFSRTTSRHINQYLRNRLYVEPEEAAVVSQNEIYNMLG